ncbi:MAG: TonB family protein [Sulfitobacter sp.]
MIPKSLLVKGISLVASVTILTAASQWSTPPPVTKLEGAGETMQARVGSSFADMSAGVLSADPAQDHAVPVEQDPHTPMAEPIAPLVTDAVAPEPTEVMHKILDTPLHAAVSVQKAIAITAPAMAVAAVIPAAPVPTDAVTAVVLSTPALAATPPPEAAQVVPSTDPVGAAPAQASRPKPRDPALAAKAATKKPKVVKKKPVKASAKAKKNPTPKKAAKAGNAKRNNTQGSVSGNKTAQARTKGTSGKKASKSGNAAVSNYPGQVMRRIGRVPKPRVNNRGTAVVAFSVSSSGGLAAASIARSSGSSALDKAALRVIRKAAPFPKPPKGARRRFTIKIKGR